MRKSMGPVALVLALGACGQEQPATNVEAERQQILQQEDAMSQAYAKRDGEAVARFYADEATRASPGEQLARGKEPVRTALGKVAEDENFTMSLRPNRVEVARSGDLAYSRGQYMMTSTDAATNQPQTTRGYYLTVWEKQGNGGWKAVESFTTPGPAMQATQRATAIL